MVKNLITTVLLLFLFGSCCTKKVAGTMQTHTIEVNKPINDHTFIPLPFIRTEIKECDSVCNEAVRIALANVGTAKTSGANSYYFNYDAFNDGFEIGANIGETRAEILKKEVVVEKKVYPWLIFLLIFVLGLFAGWKIKSIFALRSS